MAEHGLPELPHHERGQTDRHHPEQDDPGARGPDLRQRTLLVGAPTVAERDLHDQSRDEQMHRPVRDEPEPPERADRYGHLFANLRHGASFVRFESERQFWPTQRADRSSASSDSPAEANPARR